MSIRFPVADNAEAALFAPLGRAERAAEAAVLAGEAVDFVTESVGPAFASREAALDAYSGRLDDERPGHLAAIQPEDRFCALRELAAAPPPPVARKAMRPTYRHGRRWPTPAPPPRTVWRLSISYWRPRAAAEAALAQAAPAGRDARRGAQASADAQALRARARQPLRPIKPQQPLDIGLFEVRPPEAPHILMPDE